jgi:4-amino-4-deoxy-L-arabinose transferase-like glycosyltransferase
MPEPRRFEIQDLLLLLVVVAVAVAARVWYLSVIADNARSDGPIHVQDPPAVLKGLPPDTELHGRRNPSEQDALLHNLTEHRWFGCLAPFAGAEEKTAHVAPGYPWLLSWLEAIDLGPKDRTVRWLQCALGTLTAACYFLFARRAFAHRGVAALAGLLSAVHPFWVINSAEVNDGVLVTFLLAVSLLLAARGVQSGAAFSSLLYGLALAGLSLVRAALLPFAAIAVLWFLVRCRTVRRGWLCALLAFLGFANGMVPWTYRNYQAFGTIIPIADSAPFHLWMGNNPRSSGGTLSEETLLETLAEVRGQATSQVAAQLEQLQQKERYDQFTGAVLEQIKNDPAGLGKHRLEALLCFFVGEQWLKDRTLWRSDFSESPELPAWFTQSYAAILYGSLFGMLVLAVLGWRWTYAWRYQAMPSSIACIWIPLPYVLSHAESLLGPRLPLDGVLLCYAAFALVCLVPGLAGGLFYGPPISWDTEEKPR